MRLLIIGLTLGLLYACGGLPALSVGTAAGPWPEGEDSLSRRAMQDVIRAHAACIRACVPETSDREVVRVVFMIQPDGSVVDPGVRSDSSVGDELEACIVNEVGTFVLPPPGEEVEVDFPFRFANPSPTPDTTEGSGAGGPESTEDAS